MMKSSGLLSTFFALLFAGWILIAADPQVRLARACAPVGWFGNLTLSIEAFLYPQGQAATKQFFDKGDYMCRFTLWRLVYEDEYKAWQKSQEEPVDSNFSESAP